MRLRIVPVGIVFALVGTAALADSIPLNQSLADIALDPVPSSPQTPQDPLVTPGIAVPLERSLSQDLPNGDSVELYAGYPGTPALGPEVDSPLIVVLDGLQAPSGQSWLDEAFLAYGVVTAGFSHDDQQLEISRFTGHSDYRTPYDIARLDSIALRYTWKLDSKWALQGSWGALKDPESFAPRMDENRWTASAKYTLPFGRGGTWSALFAWGLKQESIGNNLNAVALDTECKPIDGWTLFARGGLEQDNALLADGALNPDGIRNNGTASVGAVHDWTLFQRVRLGAGGLYAFDFIPQPSGQPSASAARGALAYVHLTIR